MQPIGLLDNQHREKAMTRFYFDTVMDREFCSDDDGQDLPGLEAAIAEAGRALADFARDALPDGITHNFRVDVRDVDRSRFTSRMSIFAAEIDD
jgi:hypothetical protein